MSNNDFRNTLFADPLCDVLPQEIPASAPVRAPLTPAHLSYRAKTPLAKYSQNCLVAHAAGLFSLASRLRETEQYHDIKTLSEHLTHEIKAFEVNAQKQGYDPNKILLARYIICATLDDLILQTQWGHLGQWDRYRLSTVFHADIPHHQHFFHLITRLSEDAKTNIDLLELLYLSLSMGYQGYYHRDPAQLAPIMDQLYQSIRWHRGEIKKELLIAPPASEKQTHKSSSISFMLVLVLSGSILLTLYTGFAYLLTRHMAPVYQQLSQPFEPQQNTVP